MSSAYNLFDVGKVLVTAGSLAASDAAESVLVMKASKVRLMIVGIFFAIYGIVFAITPLFPQSISTKDFTRDFMLTLLIGQLVALIAVSVLIAGLIFSVFDARNRLFYWFLPVVVVVGVLAHQFMPLNSIFDYGIPVIFAILGIWMTIRAVKNQVSPKKVKKMTRAGIVSH